MVQTHKNACEDGRKNEAMVETGKLKSAMHRTIKQVCLLLRERVSERGEREGG